MSAALTIHGAPEGYDALLLLKRAAEHAAEYGGTLVHVARDGQRLERLAETLTFFAPDAEILRLPAWDCLPYDRVSPNPVIVAERIATLTRLLDPPTCDGRRIVLTTVNSLVQRVPPRLVFIGATLDIAAGGDVAPERLVAFLEANGYGRADTVMEPGEYVVRGGIIDIFPAGEDDPVRLDMFGDQIETIKRFDASTQRSSEAVASLSLRPISEIALDEASVSRFRAEWRELFGSEAASDPIYLSVSDRRKHPGMEHWEPLFHQAMETLLDYVERPAITLDSQVDEVLDARLEMIADHFDARGKVSRDGEVPYRPLPPALLYLDRNEWDAALAQFPRFVFSSYGQADGAPGIDAGGRPGIIFSKTVAQAACETVFGQLGQQQKIWAGQGRRTIVAAWTRGSRERIASLLRENGLRVEIAETWASAPLLPKNVIGLVTLGIERGFVAEDFAIVGEQDLLGRTHLATGAKAQTRRPVHRRGDGDRRRRPGGASGIRHRPL